MQAYIWEKPIFVQVANHRIVKPGFEEFVPKAIVPGVCAANKLMLHIQIHNSWRVIGLWDGRIYNLPEMGVVEFWISSCGPTGENVLRDEHLVWLLINYLRQHHTVKE